MHFEKTSPICASTPGPTIGLTVPRFSDGRSGKYKPETDVMATFIENGFIPPSMRKISKELFCQDRLWKKIEAKIK